MAKRKFPLPPAEAEFQQVLSDCGITKKGAGFARVVWLAVSEIFAALPADEAPFDGADLAYRLLRHKASDVERTRNFKGRFAKTKKGAR